MRISIVVAASENNVIGKDNALLWRLPDDLKFFKSVTLGKPIIMGRKTYDSIGRALPGRKNIVISRQQHLVIPECTVVASLDAALAAAEAEDVAVIGGADIYRQTLPLASRIYLTRVHANFEGDVFFPALDARDWQETWRELHAADERHAWAFSFIALNKNTA